MDGAGCLAEAIASHGRKRRRLRHIAPWLGKTRCDYRAIGSTLKCSIANMNRWRPRRTKNSGDLWILSPWIGMIVDSGPNGLPRRSLPQAVDRFAVLSMPGRSRHPRTTRAV